MAFVWHRSLPRFRLAPIVLFVVAVTLSAGCQTRSRSYVDTDLAPRPPVQFLKKPAIDLSRGVAGFPMQAEKAPTTPPGMVQAMSDAYEQRLEGDPVLNIEAAGDRLNRLKLLSIDLTGSTVRSTYVPNDQARLQEARPYILTDKLRYVANPLKYQNYSASLQVEAERAELTLIPTIERQWTLALSDCRTGSAAVRVGLADLRQGALAAAKTKQTVAFGINDLTFDIAAPTSRSLLAKVNVDARLFFVPAKFSISGRMRVDNSFNAHFSELSAEGHDPSGAIVAGLVQGKLDKINNKAMPLLKMPGGKIRLTDLRFNVDDALAIDVKFAGTRR